MNRSKKTNLFGVIFFLSFFWFITGLTFIAVADTYIVQELSSPTFSKMQWAELHAGDKLAGSFTAANPNLNAVAIRFNLFNRINHDHLLFSIKEKGTSQWYYKKRIKTSSFQIDRLESFNFPAVKNSKNIQYIFEIASLDGRKDDSVAIDKKNPIIESRFDYPKQDILRLNSPLNFTLTNIHSNLLSIGPALFTFVFSIYLSLIVPFLYYKKNRYVNLSIFYKLNKNNIFYRTYKDHPLLLIIHLGIFIRIVLALGSYNQDMAAIILLAHSFDRQIYNVYSLPGFYNYAFPLYFFIGVIGLIQELLKVFSFQFLYRLSISAIDLIDLFLLLKIAKELKISKIKTAFLFFLNPVAILISSFQGQSENIAVLFILWAILLHYRYAKKYTKRIFIYEWILLTLSIIAKHNVLYNLIAFWKEKGLSMRKIFFLFGLSCLVFLLSFVPFLSAKDTIIRNVFMYGSQSVLYGITFYLGKACAVCSISHVNIVQLYKYIFMVLLLTLPFLLKPNDMAKTCLFWFLFFLSFTSGIGPQYFALPIALGALFPTRWFILYTAVVTVGFMGGIEENLLLGQIPELILVFYNSIWIITLFWFLSEAKERFGENIYQFRSLKNPF